jgi:hypothetical protein
MVGRHVWHGNVTGDAGDVDDRAAALLLHHWSHHLHGLNHGKQVGLKHPPAFSEIHVRDRIHESVTGIVHPHIHSSQAAQRGCEHAFEIFAFGNVGGDGNGIRAANASARGFEPLGITRHQNKAGAVGGELLRD